MLHLNISKGTPVTGIALDSQHTITGKFIDLQQRHLFISLTSPAPAPGEDCLIKVSDGENLISVEGKISKSENNFLALGDLQEVERRPLRSSPRHDVDARGFILLGKQAAIATNACNIATSVIGGRILNISAGGLLMGVQQQLGKLNMDEIRIVIMTNMYDEEEPCMVHAKLARRESKFNYGFEFLHALPNNRDLFNSYLSYVEQNRTNAVNV